MLDKICASLATRFNSDMRTVRRRLPSIIEQWGKIEILGGGDIVRASSFPRFGEDNRDASFVRVRS